MRFLECWMHQQMQFPVKWFEIENFVFTTWWRKYVELWYKRPALKTQSSKCSFFPSFIWAKVSKLCVYFCSFDGDVDAFGSMTVKITEIKTRNNSTSVFNDSMCGFFNLCFQRFEQYICSMFMYVGCQTGNGKYLLAICILSNGKFLSFENFPSATRFLTL